MARIIKYMVLTFLINCLSQVAGIAQPAPSDTLNLKQRSIVPIAAFMATGNIPRLEQSLNSGLDAGLTINEIKEVLVQLYAYAGFPRALNALNAFDAVLKNRKAEGINDVVGKTPSPLPENTDRLKSGTAIQTKLVGRPMPFNQFSPTIDRFLKEHLFHDIFSRDNLDWRSREIATISALASLGGAEAQLKSHFNVGMNTGLTPAQLKDLVAVLTTQVGSVEGQTAGAVSSSIPGIDPASPFPKGTRITNNNFTGTAYLQMLLTTDTTIDTSIGNVTFEPGARTNWHSHPGGQILLVTSGNGFHQEKGGIRQPVKAGDVIRCAPGIIHWHGATPDSQMSHIAIGPNTRNGTVNWLEPVTDAEYRSIPGNQ